MALTHLDTPGWLVLTWKPYMEETPASLGSTWNGHTWTWNGHTWTTCTHLDGLKSLDTPGKFGHTWKHWTLEPWNLLWILPDNSYGFFQTTLMDSSRQLLCILPDNSYGFFQTTLMDSSRELLWILPDNSYGFFQTTLMDSSRQILWILPDPLNLHDPWPNW